MSNNKSLLITIIDTSPIWWGLKSIDQLNTNTTKNVNNNFNINDFVSVVVGFMNTYKTMNQMNSVALIAADNQNVHYLYPKKLDNISPWNKFDQINDINEEIKENLKIAMKKTFDDMDRIQMNTNGFDKNTIYDSLITSAMGRALCYINRIQTKFTTSDNVNYRILIIKACEDNSNQYMNFMNMIFSAEKLVKHYLFSSNSLFF
jgi:transcription initiation factor TFIIH subunit 3